ncbi:Alpha/Beta hydrolase protein [Aspergillus pseudodeflectus]|uniref:Carboxylic ester hydrolase n=2 Tax=Aspergillus subgen. Nidulantes TaxID=2720870 RepID=A0ABR4FHL8_9EURO
MKTYVSLGATALALLPLACGAASTPTVTIASPAATIVGLAGDVEQFPGIPYAKPPVGNLRFKPPVPLTEPYGMYEATENKNICPQFVGSTTDGNSLIPEFLTTLLNSPLFQKPVFAASEDCLYLNIHRPAGIKEGDDLPILFFIHGGGFQLGWNSMYDGTPWVEKSVELGKPMIVVTVAYRLGGFGFLPGREIQEEGSSNVGLLDQRLGLQWVANNIRAFGGDPAKVTVWGESAGAWSVFDQMALYSGNHSGDITGEPLFRGAILNSGSFLPADPTDGPKAQGIYDTVVDSAGCSAAMDTLQCLRNLDYTSLLDATSSVPAMLGYQSLALSYIPRPDGLVVAESPDQLALKNKVAQVPFIAGSQEDEGTVWALFQSNITTEELLVDYLNNVYFPNGSREVLEEFVSLYADISENGAPFRTGEWWNIYPEFKRLAAIVGDHEFSLTRRIFLEATESLSPEIPSWSYMSSYDHGAPVLGTFHGSDLLQVFFGIKPNYASDAFHAYYISFVNSLDPNEGNEGTYSHWPQWNESHQLLNMYADHSEFIFDDFRSEAAAFLKNNIQNFRL